MRRFSSTASGVSVRLAPEEVALLSTLPALIGSVGASDDDPAYDRLFPVAYPHDPDQQHEFSRLIAPDLEDAREGDRRRFEASLASLSETNEIEIETAEAWVRVMGEARLVLAARRGITSDDQPWEEDESDPEVGLLHYLGWLQDEMVQVLLEALQVKA